MKHEPDRSRKLLSKFSGPFLITAKMHGNKFISFYPDSYCSEVDSFKQKGVLLPPNVQPSISISTSEGRGGTFH